MSINLQVAVDMLARVEIAALSGQHNQRWWGQIIIPDGQDLIIDTDTGYPMGFGSCSTGMCAAGWALKNAGVPMDWVDKGHGQFTADTCAGGEKVADKGCELLGIDGPDDIEDDERWNYTENWPRIFDTNNTINDIYRETAAWMDTPDEALLRRLVAERMPTMAAGLPPA